MMKAIRNILFSTAASLSLLTAGNLTLPAETAIVPIQMEDPWNYEFQLYGLGFWIRGDSAIGYRLKKPGIEGSTPTADVDVAPVDLFRNIETGFMGHFEAYRNDGWGVWSDYIFMNLGPSADLGSKILNIDDLGLYQGILELFATYRLPLKKGTIEYFGGIRWWHIALDMTMRAQLPGFGTGVTKQWERDVDWYDPVIGLKWTYPLGGKWLVRLRGDLGGFDIGTASRFTSSVEAGILYDIDSSWQVDMRFRSIWADYREGSEGEEDYFLYDTVSYGPVIGITYRW